MSYLGIDLHTNSLTICYRTQQGKERIRTFALRQLDAFRKTLRKRDRVAVASFEFDLEHNLSRIG